MKTHQLDIDFTSTERTTRFQNSNPRIDEYFPEDESNRLAHRESFNKHLFRPNTYLHKWWARRSGTTFRYILKQLVADSSQRDYYKPGGLEGLTILDPMMGGGTTLHEAIRLGANTIGYDIDPIPVLQARATLTRTNLSEKEEVFSRFVSQLESRLNSYYTTDCPLCNNNLSTQYVLYGLRKCQGNEEVVVVDSFVLRVSANDEKKQMQDLYPNLCVETSGTTRRIVDKAQAKKEGINGKSSELCTTAFASRYVPLVVVAHCPVHGGTMKAVNEDDANKLSLAENRLAHTQGPPLPDFKVPHGPKSNDLLARGIRHFTDLFSARQLLYLFESKQILETISEEHRLWLALLISTSLEFNSMLCGYKGSEKRRPGAIRHVFSHHAYSFPYTALENNPVYSKPTSGTLRRLFNDRILRAGFWAKTPIERQKIGNKWEKRTIEGEADSGTEVRSSSQFFGNLRSFHVAQLDSTHLPEKDGSVDFVVTDPPYYDSVQYSDLSHFFRCWLSWYLPRAANWKYMPSSSAVAETKNDDDKFGNILGNVWKECNRVLSRPHGRLVFTYHHWRASAWAQLTVSLTRANFELLNSYTVHSENPISVHIRQLRALRHDCILVLQPNVEGRRKIWRKPQITRPTESRAFCRFCADILGWCLQSGINEDEIQEVWKAYLED